MNNKNLNNLSPLKSFKGLKRGDCVYSRRYGIVEIFSVYNDEIIISFDNFRKRISADEQDISKIPDKYLEKPSKKVEVTHYGTKISFAEFKRRRKIERQRKKLKDIKEHPERY